jgi:hypothetical protein
MEKDLSNSKPMRNGELINQEGENYYIKISDDKVYEVAPVAYYIWYMCDGNSTVDQIIERISKEANLSIEQLHDPVYTIIRELLKAELISI